VHRELASGLSMPLGFKNGTTGDTQIAVDAIGAASHGHTFLSVTKQGVSAIIHTKGNPHTHMILRGGKGMTNFDAESVATAAANIEKAGARASIMVDCSHANSKKEFKNQPIVAADVAKQVAGGDTVIRGLMIESHLNEGKQKLDPGKTFPKDLKYGVSVTDGCISFENTLPLLRELAAAVQARRAKK
jgi:3-deoxy-7-phosphoheptulonate synthase